MTHLTHGRLGSLTSISLVNLHLTKLLGTMEVVADRLEQMPEPQRRHLLPTLNRCLRLLREAERLDYPNLYLHSRIGGDPPGGGT